MPPRLFPSYKIDRDDSTVKFRPKEKGELEGSEKMGKKWREMGEKNMAGKGETDNNKDGGLKNRLNGINWNY